MSVLFEEESEYQLLFEGKSTNPHKVLGLHRKENSSTIRLFRPGAKKVSLEVLGKKVNATQILEEGIFEYEAPFLEPNDYRIYYPNGLLAHDPYAQERKIDEMDEALFSEGRHYSIYSVLGATIKEDGVLFAVWAPNAVRVSLIAEFNHWDGRLYPMRLLGVSGIWELFVPGLKEREMYKFEVLTKEGKIYHKIDPFTFFSEKRPKTASIVYDLTKYSWKHQYSQHASMQGPINIYEVHLGSWKKKEGKYLTYQELAHELAAYCKKMHFTHVELMPVMEHLLDESWGYQLTGFFAATSRFGTPSDFQYFVDYMHGEGIGVILDWVPGHFPLDECSLARFDGTCLYEHEDPRKGFHPLWKTAIFNYGRKEVSNFLIASALFWFDQMKIDGLRVDAVASLIYLDYARKEGEWIPNPDGSQFNWEAIEFIKHMNHVVHERFPYAIMMAEESSSFQGVTHQEGLGFDLKWNMGWMNDILSYISLPFERRKEHQNKLTFSLLYQFTEQFMSVFSHDEVVHGKRSLLSKMPGSKEEQFASLRLLYSYMICHPGKNLFFMGGEFGQIKEWNCKDSLDWKLLQDPLHQGMQNMVEKINQLYLKHPALWEEDFHWQGFEWVDFQDTQNSVIAYLRKSKKETLLCIHHFSNGEVPRYFLKMKENKKIKLLFSTEEPHFGGKIQSLHFEKKEGGLEFFLPPLSTLIFSLKD